MSLELKLAQRDCVRASQHREHHTLQRKAAVSWGVERRDQSPQVAAGRRAHREGHTAPCKVRLQLLTERAVADEREVRAVRQLLQDVSQSLQVLLCARMRQYSIRLRLTSDQRISKEQLCAAATRVHWQSCGRTASEGSAGLPSRGHVGRLRHASDVHPLPASHT